MELTVKALKDAFGEDYPVINKLVVGRPDDFVFKGWDLICRSDYIATKLWQEEDIANVLREMGYEGTQEQVDDVVCAVNFDEALGDCTDQDWEVIYQACEEAGYKDKHARWVYPQKEII